MQIEVVYSLRAFSFTRPCINLDRKSRLACIRIGFIASEKWNKKVTLASYELKATLKKIILQPKKKKR